MDFKSCSELELWEYVAGNLKQDQIDTVLVGGAVAAIYSEGAYRSGDLDLIIENYRLDESQLTKSMNRIGFTKQGKYWVHPDCSHLYVEFVSPPIAIGDDYKIEPIEVEQPINNQKIKTLSPMDCVRDRLCSYVYFKTRDCFDQAYLVARRQGIETKALRKWAKTEGKQMVDALNELEKKLEANYR